MYLYILLFLVSYWFKKMKEAQIIILLNQN